jgi:hypothetical protein
MGVAPGHHLLVFLNARVTLRRLTGRPTVGMDQNVLLLSCSQFCQLFWISGFPEMAPNLSYTLFADFIYDRFVQPSENFLRVSIVFLIVVLIVVLIVLLLLLLLLLIAITTTCWRFDFSNFNKIQSDDQTDSK